MWPGFRVTFLKRTKGQNELKVQILEPAYYWRVNRDYDAIPTPTIVYFHPSQHNLGDIRDKLFASETVTASRIVLHHAVVSSQVHTQIHYLHTYILSN